MKQVQMRIETMNSQGKVVKTKLFIGNLDPATQTAELNELFAPFGSVLEASVIKDYGFVHFGTIEEAEKAVAGLNNKEFHGKRLRVELSTSTVRHRPGQPEPASALRHSRSRTGASAGGNGNSRYTNAAPQGGGVGPMRHNVSNWNRNDGRPYPNLPRDPPPMIQDYPLGPGGYDRPRSYDPRAEPRRYYPDGRDHSYPPGYDAPPYGGAVRGGGGGDPADVYSSRQFRDLPPHGHVDNTGYVGVPRPYDRHGDLSPSDPYYDGPAPSGSMVPSDPYRNYDPYQKYYSGRPRESEYLGPASVPAPPPPQSRDYDPYPNYRSDPYGSTNGQGPIRGHPSGLSSSQHQGAYPPVPVPSHRPQPMYGGGSSGGPVAPGYPPSGPHSHYYGAHQRP